MSHRALLVLAVACIVSTALPLAAQAADSPAFLDACTAPTSTTAAAPAAADRLFAPEAENRVTPPKYGPCTMSFRCSSACGGQFISCSGQNYCEMNYGPRYYSCHQNIYVRCDNQEPIYCIGEIVP